MPTAIPRISIVTPSFNQARYLRQCIESVLGQDDPNIESIIVDGGSTDESVDVLRSFGEKVKWTSERDRGQADAVNRGLRQATGEIVGWLNSDDVLAPGALAHVRSCMQANPEAAFIYGRAWMIDGEGNRLREYPTFDLKRDDLKRKCYFCQPAVFLRREAIERFGMLNEALDICIDYEWWLRIAREAPIAFCDAILASSRHYTTTKTSARRLRALVEAGYLMRHHFGKASWRWSAKWMVHRMKLNPWNALVMPCNALRYRERFDGAKAPSRYGARLLAALGTSQVNKSASQQVARRAISSDC
jgi:glycosyltransferase involved in cell wall biosynthesis